MEWYEWVFDGIGTQIMDILIGLVIGGCTGGFVGYKIGNKNQSKQKQQARDNANQTQIGNVAINSTGGLKSGDK